MITVGVTARSGRRMGRVIALLCSLAPAALCAAPGGGAATSPQTVSPQTASPQAAQAAADSPGPRACAPGLVELRAASGPVRYRVELADTPDSRARGLMFRTELAADSGMLFLFDPPRPVAFWMRNTPLPLDLIFIDIAGVVRNVTRDAVPYSESLMPSGGVVRAVLEVNAGQARANGLVEGVAVRHPAFGPDAVWPCP